MDTEAARRNAKAPIAIYQPSRLFAVSKKMGIFHHSNTLFAF
jgi:hypothetical protein